VVGTGLPIHSISNSVDLGRFSPDGATLDLDARCGLPPSGAGVVRVGLVSTFARWKGHHLFLEAVGRLPPSLNVRAYVIGGPVYATENSEVSLEELRTAAARRATDLQRRVQGSARRGLHHRLDPRKRTRRPEGLLLRRRAGTR
jgi:glycosyltransferase involved in cell wall biosynthesis